MNPNSTTNLSLFKSVMRYALLLALLCTATGSWADQDGLLGPSWTSVTIGVADLDKALELWVGIFGLTQLASSEGEDAELAALWRIMPSDIKRQALLGTPGSEYGKLHLVEFTEPGPAVREGADLFDLSPKDLTVYARDLPARVKEMQAKGLSFLTAEPSDVSAADGTLYREIHLPAHDEINVVLLEVMGKEMTFSDKGFAGIGPLIAIINQASIERTFYAGVMGMDLLDDNTFEASETGTVEGLPPGAKLDVSIWGDENESLGQMELVDFPGNRSNNLYPVTVPTQLGILHVSYKSKDLDAFKQKLHEAGLNHIDREYREVIFGSGRFIRFRTPAGMNIEAFESAD